MDGHLSGVNGDGKYLHLRELCLPRSSGRWCWGASNERSEPRLERDKCGVNIKLKNGLKYEKRQTWILDPWNPWTLFSNQIGEEPKE